MLKRIYRFFYNLFFRKRRKKMLDKAMVAESTGTKIINKPGKPKGARLKRDVSHFNMPRTQPCPGCSGWRRRVRKTAMETGAFYKCGNHGEYFVAK